jgi:hypothetical protein
MKRSKKRWALLGIVAAIALSAIGAFAYFTAAGSGTGNAEVGSASAIVITSDPNPSDLYPGGADQAVAVHVNNPGSGNQYVDDVSGTVANNGACLGSWFQVDTIDLDTTVAAGATVNDSTAIRMTDSGSSQNACQGLTMTINWVSS